jgi:hypothetical protein
LQNYQLLFPLVFQEVFYGNHHYILSHIPAEKKLEYVRGWLKRPPRALPPCFLAWVKSLPENEKETIIFFLISKN